jgi:hypothetical protein
MTATVGGDSPGGDSRFYFLVQREHWPGRIVASFMGLACYGRLSLRVVRHLGG